MNSIVTQDEAIAALQAGGIGVLPTDTIYGLTALANSQAAVERLYAIKHREQKPGTVVAASIDQLVDLGLKRRYLTPFTEYWPNPLSVIIPSELHLKYLDQGKMSLAVRIPKDTVLQEILVHTGPLLTTSANNPGEPSANTVSEAMHYFGDTIDFYVDGGDLSDRQPSTIMRVIDDEIVVLRQGAIDLDKLRKGR